MSTDIKLSKTQLSKVIKSEGFIGALLGKLAIPLMKVAVSLSRSCFGYFLAPSATTAAASAVDDAVQRRMSGRGAIKGGKGITLAILNQDMDDINRIIKSLENLDVFIDGVSKTIKHEIKR